MRNIRNTITPALVLDKHMIPCRDENEKRLLYAYLSKKRELAEHLSQIIYVLDDVAERCNIHLSVVYGVHTIIDCNVTYIMVWEKYLDISTRFKIIPPQS